MIIPIIFLDNYDLPRKHWIAHDLDKGRMKLLCKYPRETEQESNIEEELHTIIDERALYFYVS
jgi:hypothetical protein